MLENWHYMAISMGNLFRYQKNQRTWSFKKDIINFFEKQETKKMG